MFAGLLNNCYHQQRNIGYDIYIDSIVQICGNSRAVAMELLLYYTKPSIWLCFRLEYIFEKIAFFWLEKHSYQCCSF